MPEPTNSPTPSILNQLFNAAGISRVVFVDDRFGITPERIQAEVNELSVEDLQKSGAFPNVDFSSDSDDIRRGLIEKAIDAAGTQDHEIMFDKMAAIRYEYGDAERDQNARTYFNAIVGEAAETVYLSLKQWERHKDELLAEAAEKPTLFVFDEDFTLEGQSKTHGRRLINETHTVNTGYKFVYALLTHNAQNDDQEIALQATIATQDPDLAEYLLVIAKTRLDNGDRFAERMKQLLLYRLFQLLKRKLIHETAEASKLAVSEIEGLGIESFERIILGTSRIEGAWSPETLVRVIGVYQQQHIKQNIRKDAGLHLAVREIDPICQVPTTKTDAVTAQAQRLQQDEIYEPGAKINSVHVPIAAGDIFKDTQGNQYILLAQPCDLMVRGDGLRRKGERDPRQMAPMAIVSKVSSKYKEQGLPSDQYELPLFVLEERWSVKLNEIYQLPIWLLDLAALNEDGQCLLREDQTAPSLLISPWRTRLPILLDRAKAIVTVASKVVDESIDKSALVHSCSRVPLGSPFQVEITQSAETPPKWSFALKLTRVSRVSELHSTGVLIDYAAYMARLAHPHDLARV